MPYSAVGIDGHDWAGPLPYSTVGPGLESVGLAPPSRALARIATRQLSFRRRSASTIVDARCSVVAGVDERCRVSSLQYRTVPYRGVVPSIGGNDGQPQVRLADVCARRFDGRAVTVPGASR